MSTLSIARWPAPSVETVLGWAVAVIVVGLTLLVVFIPGKGRRRVFEPPRPSRYLIERIPKDIKRFTNQATPAPLIIRNAPDPRAQKLAKH
jgi:hypothetical protein